MLSSCGAGENSWKSLGLQGDQPVDPKGNQPWILFGRTDAKAPILWPPDANSWLIGKHPDSGKDWRLQKEKRALEDEMVGWHHQFNGHELGQTPGDGEEQGSLECCSPWGLRKSDMTWRLNNSHSWNILLIFSWYFFHLYLTILHGISSGKYSRHSFNSTLHSHIGPGAEGEWHPLELCILHGFTWEWVHAPS